MSRPWRTRQILSALASSAAIAGYLAFAHFSGAMVDETYGAESAPAFAQRLEGIDHLGWWLLGTLAFILAATYQEGAGFTEVGERAAARLRGHLHRHLLSLPMAFFSKERTGELASRLLTDSALLQESWTNDLRQAVKHGSLAVGSIALLFITAPKLALFIALTVPPTVVVGLVFGRLIRERSARAQDRLAAATIIADESLQGIAGVKACSNEDWETGRFHEALRGYIAPAVSVGRSRAAFVCAIAFIVLAAMVGLMWQGSREIAAHRLSPGELTSFMFYLALLANAGAAIGELVSRLQRMAGASARILTLLGETPEPAGEGWHPDPSNTAQTTRLTGAVAFREVSFSYPARPGQPVLSGFSLDIAPGDRVALVGPSGAGKSTLAALLFRLYEPDSGRILVDGRDLREYAAAWLRQQMALVPQDIQLFGGTVAENIAYGCPESSEAAIRDAARRAQAEEFIELLPRGYETLLGDRGWQLSGGQRQRLAIARAILKNPAILVLDEATSALDHENERLVRLGLEELMRGRTTLIIAHRLSTVRDAKRIAVIRAGALAECGSHAELMARDGFYRELCEREFTAPPLG